MPEYDPHRVAISCAAYFGELRIYLNHLQTILDSIDRTDAAIKKHHDEIAETFDYENDDDGTVWARAQERVVGYDTNFIPYFQRSAIRGLFIIGIFHAFEKLLESIFKYHVDPSHEVDKFTELLKKCPEIRILKSFEKINEMRLVCNVFKHGQGDARNQLRARNPELFPLSSEGIVQSPLSGDDLYIESSRFEEYMQAIRSFLNEMFGYEEDAAGH